MSIKVTPNLEALPLSALDLQILLVLSQGELYGYAIKKAVERESDGIPTKAAYLS